jgi:hypothetical protein
LAECLAHFPGTPKDEFSDQSMRATISRCAQQREQFIPFSQKYYFRCSHIQT